MRALNALVAALRDAPAELVTVLRTQGSAPCEAGAWMALLADGSVLGTIGGGHLEHEAIAIARARLATSVAAAAIQRRVPLGPSLGQCCGGAVQLSHERVTAADADALQRRLAPELAPVALFGGGHVGRAIARLMDGLPLALTWIDSRDGVFPPAIAPNVRCEHSDPVQRAVRDLAPASAVLVMSFSHAEDLEIVAAALARRRARGDLRFVGLIGSATKWATFRARLAARGFTDDELAAVSCPIGLPGVVGKQPAVLALAAVAQLLALPLHQ